MLNNWEYKVYKGSSSSDQAFVRPGGGCERQQARGSVGDFQRVSSTGRLIETRQSTRIRGSQPSELIQADTQEKPGGVMKARWPVNNHGIQMAITARCEK